MKLGIPMPASIDSILESGFCGIGLFFTLSGFVLSYVYGEIDPNDPIAKRNFWAARFARVYPIHIVGFVLATPFVILHRMAKSSGLALLVKIVTATAASLTLTQARFWPLSRTLELPRMDAQRRSILLSLFHGSQRNCVPFARSS